MGKILPPIPGLGYGFDGVSHLLDEDGVAAIAMELNVAGALLWAVLAHRRYSSSSAQT